MFEDSFPESDRRIFGPVSWDGASLLYLDPTRVQRRLDQVFGGTVGELLERWRSPDPQTALPAAESFLAGIREAFEAPPFDPATGNGATEQQVRQVWDAWLAWTSKKNESTPASPT